MAKTASRFSRSKPRFKPQPRVLILCEDSKSCLAYLSDAARHFRSFAIVEIAHCGKTDPKGIVKEAKRRSKDFESIYCVIDEDEHPSFEQALAMAQGNAPVRVIASYPCYEFWLLLHFKMSRSAVQRAGAQSAGARMVKALRAAGLPDYDKGTQQRLFENLLERLPSARANSAAALCAAMNEDSMNPSTQMHLLIDVLECLGHPPPAG